MIFLLQSCTMRLNTTHPTSLYNSHGQMQTTKQDMHEHSWLKRAWLTGAIQARVIQATNHILMFQAHTTLQAAHRRGSLHASLHSSSQLQINPSPKYFIFRDRPS
jgi:hypothetical protein